MIVFAPAFKLFVKFPVFTHLSRRLENYARFSGRGCFWKQVGCTCFDRGLA